MSKKIPLFPISKEQNKIYESGKTKFKKVQWWQEMNKRELSGKMKMF